MSLHKPFPFFFQHFYCFLQFLRVTFVIIRLPFQNSCLRHQQWGSFQILISFINKIFELLIKMLIYFWKISALAFTSAISSFMISKLWFLVSLSSFSRFCFFASSYFTLEDLPDSKFVWCILFQVSHYRKSCGQLLFDVHLMIQH